MRWFLSALILAAGLIPGLVQAQIAPNSWFVVPKVNYNVATIKDFGSSINGLGAGIQLDRVLGGRGVISLGITADYLHVDGTVSEAVQGPSGPEELLFSAKVQGAPIAAYGRYLFGGPGIIGYLGLGPGIFIGESTINLEAQPSRTQSTSKFAGLALAGGMFPMGERVYLSAGVTLYYIPDAELFAEYNWAGNLGVVVPFGNP